MGIADECDRTLFVGNLDQKVTEELLFELFLQAGPLIKVKIPKDNEGKQKSFGFAVFKHEESAPYGMNLLNGTSLFGRTLKVQFRAGSTHLNSPGQQDSSPKNTPNPHGARYDKTPDQMASPSFSPPQHPPRSFSSPDSLQRQVMRNNMWQVQMQQLQQLQQLQQITGGFPGLQPVQHQPPQQQLQQGSRCGNGGGSWKQDSPSPRGHRQSYQQDSGSNSHHGRDQRYPGSDSSGAGPARHHRGQRSDHYQHDDRGGNRSRNQDRWTETSREGRWRRY